MHYQDFTITICAAQGDYLVTAQGDGIGRVASTPAAPDARLLASLAEVVEAPKQEETDHEMRAIGEALFHWLTSGPIENHLRLAWDRAYCSHQGLRLRLSIDAPELAAWPWELLHDPERDHAFAASHNTPVVRYLDQANQFGSLAEQETELPLSLLQVLPTAPDLDLAQERRNLQWVAGATPMVLRVSVLDGIVTRADLADALLMGNYDIIHFSGHGEFIAGRGYVGLNKPDGGMDWVHSGAFSRLAVNYRSIKLVVLNTCSSGRVDDSRAFQGLAPQMVRHGVPAVVAMQFPIADEAGATFALEFYKRLCIGEDAGQVDVAAAYARGMLAVLHPHDRSWGAPVVFTHAPDGAIYRLRQTAQVKLALDPVLQKARLAALRASLQSSREMAENWLLADRGTLLTWRQTLRRAEEAYRAHTSERRRDTQQVARTGLTLVQDRLADLDRALAATTS